jgi:hypothetical protein
VEYRRGELQHDRINRASRPLAKSGNTLFLFFRNATNGCTRFWTRISFWSGPLGLHCTTGSYAGALIRTVRGVCALGAIGSIGTTTCVSTISSFETTLQPLRWKRRSVDQHPPCRIDCNIRGACKSSSRRDHRCRCTDRKCRFSQQSTPANRLVVTYGVLGHCAPRQLTAP